MYKQHIPDNVVLISNKKTLSDYLPYIKTLLDVKKFDTIILKAAGNACNNCTYIAEHVKEAFGGLHQKTEFGKVEIESTIFEEGREYGARKTYIKEIPSVTIELSRNQTLDHKDESHIHSNDSDNTKYTPYTISTRGGRGRGRFRRSRGYRTREGNEEGDSERGGGEFRRRRFRARRGREDCNRSKEDSYEKGESYERGEGRYRRPRGNIRRSRRPT